MDIIANPDVVEVLKDAGEEAAIQVGTKLAVASIPYIKKRKPFQSIKRIFKLSDGYSPDIAVYMSSFLNFNTGCVLENVNKSICDMLSKYRVQEDSNKIKYKDVEFEVFYQYKYSDNVYARNELVEIESPFGNVTDEFLVPAVSGVSVYVYPEALEQDIEKQLVSGYCLLDEFENHLLVFHIIARGKFLYLLSATFEEKKRLKKYIEDKYERFKKKGEDIRYLNSRSAEIKIKFDKLVSARLGEILSN